MPPETEQEKEDVKEEPSSASNETTEPTEVQEQEVEQALPASETDKVDEKGVPWKNREAELRRKITEEMQPWIQQQIQEGIRQGISSQPQTTQPQTTDPVQTQLAPYSDDQLETLAENNPEWKYAIRKELNRRIEDRASERAYKRIQGESQKERTEREQAESFSYIQQTFPDAFINIGGQGMWNTQSPLVQRAFAIYNSDPAFKSNGRGLRAAFLQAKGEIALTDSGNLTKQKLKINAQQRRQEKAESQAIQAGGQTAPAPSGNAGKVKLAKLMEQHRKTGDPQTFAEILKLKGAMPVFE